MFDKMIKIEEGFQTSVNIAYDLNDDGKIKKFIPTMSSIDIIEDILLSVIPTSTQRARILIGAYGRGKSHIILVLMALLSKKDTTLFANLMNKIKHHNAELYDYICNYLESNQKLLPVIVTGSSSSLTQSFMGALQVTLERENLMDVMPDTNFDAAKNTLYSWKDNYPETYAKFIEKIDQPIEVFLSKLENYSVEAYDKFVSIYPLLTSGGSFNPFVGFDVVEIYEKVNDKLLEKGYNGMFIVYDEFSKYLESSISNASISDIKLLQDFAEKCNRSARKQLHLLLICHKDISNYIDGNLPKDKVDGWRGVSGRFKHIDLQNNFSQIYEIISAVILKEKDIWSHFLEENSDFFGDLVSRFCALDLFGTSEIEKVKEIVCGCYPLHPISVFALPRISEKIAQNERTLFTFLSANEKYSLFEFLEKNNSSKSLLTVDYIYDYFEPLMRKEAYTSEAHKLYQLTSTVLRRLDENSLETKIIKFISLIYLVAQFEKLPPTVDMIVEAFKDSVDDQRKIHETLDKLLQKDCIVYLKRSNNYLKIKESSGVDLPTEINKKIASIANNQTLEEVLNSLQFDNYLYPTRYNDENDIVRYFDFKFVEATKFLSGKFNALYELEISEADGIVYAIVTNNDKELFEVKEQIINKWSNCERAVFIMPKKAFDVTAIAYEHAAVKVLKDSVSDDNVLFDEYSVYIEDLDEVLLNYINSYIRPELNKSEYYYKGEKVTLYRKAQFSALLSTICETVFPYTPIINNEAINKNYLPTVALNSRAKVINGILDTPLKPNLGLVGTGQDVSIMRSVLIRTGILVDVDTFPRFVFDVDNEKIRYVLNEIKSYLLDVACAENSTFYDLYDRLTSSKYGIGLKKGVIPILLAVVISEMKESITILYRKKELKLTGELFNDINDSPSDYTIKFTEWNSDKEEYVKGLISVFSDYIKDTSTIGNFNNIVDGMSRWYLSLPKYSKEMTEIYLGNGGDKQFKSISKNKKHFINALKQVDINPQEFLFTNIFKIFGMTDFNSDVIDNIQITKQEFDSAVDNLIKTLAIDVKDIFNGSNKGVSFYSAIKDWCESLNPKTFEYLFANNENRILELLVNVTNDEKQMVQRLAKVVTFLRIDDWSSKTIVSFLGTLKEFKNTVEEYNSKVDSGKDNSANSYKFTFISTDGKEETKVFEITDYSRRANLLKNEIETALEEMGQSISIHEKRQVLIEIFKKLC